jgi:hypothetical protein
MLVLTMALAATAAAPVAAQLLAGMPAWNSPKGGTGLTLSADYGLPNSDAGGGDAYGIRGSFGFSKFTIAAGYSGYQADGAADRLSSYGAGPRTLLGGALAAQLQPHRRSERPQRPYPGEIDSDH